MAPRSLVLVPALLITLATGLSAQTGGDAGTVLRPGDAVRITVWRQPELSGEFTISETGTITHPLYRELVVTGMPVEQARERVHEHLARLESNPQFVVQALLRVSVGGEVRQPSLYRLTPETSIAEAVATAGGVTERGRMDRVRLFRDGEVLMVDLASPQAGLAQEPIRSGDQLFVDRRTSVFRDYVAPAGGIVAGLGDLAQHPHPIGSPPWLPSSSCRPAAGTAFPGPPSGPPPGWSPDPDPLGEETVHLRDVFLVLRRHLALVLGVTAVVFGVAVYLVLTQAPEYRARAVLRLTNERGAITGGIEGAAMEGMFGKTNDPLLSELEVLRSRAVALEVLRRTPLRLVPERGGLAVGALRHVAIDPDAPADTFVLRFAATEFTLRGKSGEAEGAYGAPVQLAGMTFTLPARPEDLEEERLIALDREEAIERLREGMTARPREKTDVVDVEFTSTDPMLAQQVVNATVEAFSELNTETAQESSRRRRIFLGEQLQQTDSALAMAQVALSDFRRREAVYSSRDNFSAQQTGLMGLDVRREELDSDRRMYQSLLSGLQRRETSRGLETLVSAPGIASNPVISQLYTQLIQYQTSRDSLTTGAWGSAQTNPDVQRLNALVAGTERKLVDAVRSHVDALDARLAALDDLRARNESQLQALPDAEAEEMRLVQQVETARKLADQLREEFQKARIAEAVEVGQVTIVDMASLPSEPIGSGRSLKLALGLVLGLMLGSGGAFLREHMNTAIRRREEIESVLHVPGLAVIPQILPAPGGRKVRFPMPIRGGRVALAGGAELVTMQDGFSSGAEAFRLLRTNLIFSQSVNALKSLVVTSTTPGDGKTTTAANLAVSYAQQGLRVLLIDCDLRRSRLHKVFRVPMEPGLTELVMGHLGPGEVVRATDVPNLSLLPAGTRPPNPAELLGGLKMGKVLELLGQGFDLVILDTPPLMAAADAAILGARVDGVLMVIRAGQTDRGAAQHAMQQLHNVGARVVGAVLNDPDAEVQRYGGYYYYDYYGDDSKAAV